MTNRKNGWRSSRFALTPLKLKQGVNERHMRFRKLFGMPLPVLGLGLLVLIWFWRKEPFPLIVAVKHIDPAAIFDDQGEEFRLVTIDVSDSGRPHPGKSIFVRCNG